MKTIQLFFIFCTNIFETQCLPYTSSTPQFRAPTFQALSSHRWPVANSIGQNTSRHWGFHRERITDLTLEKPTEMAGWPGFRQVSRLLELCQNRNKGRVSVACRKIAPNRIWVSKVRKTTSGSETLAEPPKVCKNYRGREAGKGIGNARLRLQILRIRETTACSENCKAFITTRSWNLRRRLRSPPSKDKPDYTKGSVSHNEKTGLPPDGDGSP